MSRRTDPVAHLSDAWDAEARRVEVEARALPTFERKLSEMRARVLRECARDHREVAAGRARPERST